MCSRSISDAALLVGTLLLLECTARADPAITLDAPTVAGAMIKTKGTYDKGGLNWKSFGVVAVLKDGGAMFVTTYTTEPGGGNGKWPTAGTVNFNVPYKGTYKVYAVLNLEDAGGTASYASAVQDAVVGQGDDPPPEKYIYWGTNQPTVGKAGMIGMIAGSGTFTKPPNIGDVINGISLWWFPASGGRMTKVDSTYNQGNIPPTWGPANGGGLTIGTAYNVITVYNFTSGGSGFQYGTPIVSRTP